MRRNLDGLLQMVTRDDIEAAELLFGLGERPAVCILPGRCTRVLSHLCRRVLRASDRGQRQGQ